LTHRAARFGVSHRTLLAVSVLDGGYDCYEWPDPPRASAAALRRIDPPPDRTTPNLPSVYGAVSFRRHERLVVVPETGPTVRYCALSLSLDGFCSESALADRSARAARGDDRGYLIAVEDDETAVEFRRLWDGARAVAAVLVEEHGRPRPAAERILGAALDRLAYDRTVVGPVGAG
jgi:hypothetical protein